MYACGWTNAELRRTAGVAAMVTKRPRPTTRIRRPARSLWGRVDVEPPSATGEMTRRSDRGDQDGEADDEGTPPHAAAPGAR